MKITILKKLPKYLILFLIVSCNSGKTFVSSEVNLNNVEEILLFNPVITETEIKNELAKNKLVHRIDIISDSILSLNPQYKIFNKASLSPSQNEQLRNELLVLKDSILDDKSLKGVGFSIDLKTLFQKNEQRFGYFTLVDAKYNTYGSYLANKTGGDFIIYAGDGDTVVHTQITITGFIFDFEKNQIIKFKRKKYKSRYPGVIIGFYAEMFQI